MRRTMSRVVQAGEGGGRFENIAADAAVQQVEGHLRVLAQDLELCMSLSPTAGAAPPRGQPAALLQPRRAPRALGAREMAQVVRSVASRVHHCHELLTMLQTQHAAHRDGAEAVLEAQLQAMKPGARRKRALAVGVTDDDIEDIEEDEEDPKAALIALIVERTAPAPVPKLPELELKQLETRYRALSERVERQHDSLREIADSMGMQDDVALLLQEPAKAAVSSTARPSSSSSSSRAPLPMTVVSQPATARVHRRARPPAHRPSSRFETRRRAAGLANPPQPAGTTVRGGWRLDPTSTPGISANANAHMRAIVIRPRGSHTARVPASRAAVSRPPRPGKRRARPQPPAAKASDAEGAEDVPCAPWHLLTQQSERRLVGKVGQLVPRPVSVDWGDEADGLGAEAEPPTPWTLASPASADAVSATGDRPHEHIARSLIGELPAEKLTLQTGNTWLLDERRAAVPELAEGEEDPGQAVAAERSYSKSHLLAAYDHARLQERGDLSPRFLPGEQGVRPPDRWGRGITSPRSSPSPTPTTQLTPSQREDAAVADYVARVGDSVAPVSRGNTQVPVAASVSAKGSQRPRALSRAEQIQCRLRLRPHRLSSPQIWPRRPTTAVS